MASIATRTGDDGNTALFGGGRVPKDNPRVVAYGEVDELNSFIGLARTEPLEETCERSLLAIQSDLFHLGAELATPRDGNPHAARVAQFGDGPIARIERDLDTIEARVKPLERFILPGGTRAAALLHATRAVCRRAERAVVTLARQERVPASAIRYLNRLSDLLFLMARFQNAAAGAPETEWRP
jgi:cob(I)alamin adenosyltransferase